MLGYSGIFFTIKTEIIIFKKEMGRGLRGHVWLLCPLPTFSLSLLPGGTLLGRPLPPLGGWEFFPG